jgi:hypothetical protein
LRQLFEEDGAAGRNIVVVFTDGESDEPTKTKQSAAALKQKIKNLAVYAVGVGNIQQSDLEILATSPQHVFFAQSINMLDTYFQEIASEITPCPIIPKGISTRLFELLMPIGGSDRMFGVTFSDRSRARRLAISMGHSD